MLSDWPLRPDPRRRNSFREIMSAKYGWLHMSDSIDFGHFIRFRIFFSRSLIDIFTAHARFHFVRNVSHFAQKKRSWSQTLRQDTF